MPKCIPEMSADNRVLKSEISRLERGTLVTYAEHFTNWLGRPITCSADLRSFQSVVNALRSDYDLILGSVPGIGYKILTNDEIAADQHRMDRIRRQARLIKKERATVDTTKLTAPQLQQHVGHLAVANVIEVAAKDKTIGKIASSINGAMAPPALAHCLELVKKNV